MVTENGRHWFETLDPELRPVVREWMNLPPREFQGRMAMELALLRQDHQVVKGMVASSGSGWWKQTAVGFGAFVGGVLAALLGKPQ